MEFLYILGSILVLVIALVVDYIIAKQFRIIAELKGHDGDSYFWFTFIFGIAGMLMVVALPDVYHENEEQPSNIAPKTSISASSSASAATAGDWVCTCGKVHKNYESSCVCGMTKLAVQREKNT